MPAYVELIEDSKGDLADILYYCEWHRGDILPWPCSDWPEYDVHCATCDALVHCGATEHPHLFHSSSEGV